MTNQSRSLKNRPRILLDKLWRVYQMFSVLILQSVSESIEEIYRNQSKFIRYTVERPATPSPNPLHVTPAKLSKLSFSLCIFPSVCIRPLKCVSFHSATVSSQHASLVSRNQLHSLLNHGRRASPETQRP